MHGTVFMQWGSQSVMLAIEAVSSEMNAVNLVLRCICCSDDDYDVCSAIENQVTE